MKIKKKVLKLRTHNYSLNFKVNNWNLLNIKKHLQ